MPDFLADLSRRIADRWATDLLGAGFLFVIALIVARLLGHHQALDLDALVAVSRQAAEAASRTEPLSLMLAAGIVVAASAAGIVARGLGGAVEQLWLLARPARLLAPLVRQRRARWHAANNAVVKATKLPGETPDAFEARLARLAAKRNRICLTEPARATWIGDRIRGAGTRVMGQYGIDASAAWPRLWILLPDSLREDIRIARRGFSVSAVKSAWGFMYLGIACWLWWPAMVPGALLVLYGWRQGRSTAATLADLVESAFDLHSGALAETLGVPTTARAVHPGVGEQINERLRKGA